MPSCHFQPALVAALAFGFANVPLSSAAQTAPPAMPTIPPQSRVPLPVKPPPATRPSDQTIADPARQRETARANTSIVRNGIRIVNFDNPRQGDYRVRYIVRGVADNPASRIIVERKGKCGWTTTSFDGSRPERTADRYAKCRLDFASFSAAVAALAERPPAHRDYYELRVDKYDRAKEGWAQFIAQPVMMVVDGPGARVTRHRLAVLPNAPAPQAAGKVDDDGDGHAPFSAGGTDCDDNDGSRYPGNDEIPNDRDEDCDPRTIGTLDRDGDGFTDWRVSNPAFGGVRTPRRGRDCNDRDAEIHPNKPEDLGDGIDNNCDGAVDYYPD